MVAGHSREPRVYPLGTCRREGYCTTGISPVARCVKLNRVQFNAIPLACIPLNKAWTEIRYETVHDLLDRLLCPGLSACVVVCPTTTGVPRGRRLRFPRHGRTAR